MDHNPVVLSHFCNKFDLEPWYSKGAKYSLTLESHHETMLVSLLFQRRFVMLIMWLHT